VLRRAGNASSVRGPARAPKGPRTAIRTAIRAEPFAVFRVQPVKLRGMAGCRRRGASEGHEDNCPRRCHAFVRMRNDEFVWSAARIGIHRHVEWNGYVCAHRQESGAVHAPSHPRRLRKHGECRERLPGHCAARKHAPEQHAPTHRIRAHTVLVAECNGLWCVRLLVGNAGVPEGRAHRMPVFGCQLHQRDDDAHWHESNDVCRDGERRGLWHHVPGGPHFRRSEVVGPQPENGASGSPEGVVSKRQGLLRKQPGAFREFQWRSRLAEFPSALTVIPQPKEPMTSRGMLTEAFVLACELQQQLRGKRKRYLKRAWRIVHHLPHWPDGASKGAALAMLVLLVVAAGRARRASSTG